MTTDTAGVERIAALAADLSVEIAAAADASDATPLERAVAEALVSDHSRVRGLVDKVWVVNVPEARKAIAAVRAFDRQSDPTPLDAGVEELAGRLGSLEDRLKLAIATPSQASVYYLAVLAEEALSVIRALAVRIAEQADEITELRGHAHYLQHVAPSSTSSGQTGGA